MPVRKTAEQASERWVTGMSGAGAAIAAGVDRVSESPGVKAARKFDKWVAGLQASQQKWRTRVAATTLEDWKASMKNIGAQRAASGAQAKRHKMEAFQREWIAYLSANQGRIDSMPDTTYEQRKQKAIAQMDLNHNFRRQGSGGAPQ